MLHPPYSPPPPVSVVRTPEPTLDVEFATQQEMNARIRSTSEEELETIAEAVRPAPISHREGISDRDVDVRIRESTPAETASSTEFLQETVTTVTEISPVVLARGISVEELETSQPQSEQSTETVVRETEIVEEKPIREYLALLNSSKITTQPAVFYEEEPALGQTVVLDEFPRVRDEPVVHRGHTGDADLEGYLSTRRSVPAEVVTPSSEIMSESVHTVDILDVPARRRKSNAADLIDRFMDRVFVRLIDWLVAGLIDGTNLIPQIVTALSYRSGFSSLQHLRMLFLRKRPIFPGKKHRKFHPPLRRHSNPPPPRVLSRRRPVRLLRHRRLKRAPCLAF